MHHKGLAEHSVGLGRAGERSVEGTRRKEAYASGKIVLLQT